jgi:hypothetical protein
MSNKSEYEKLLTKVRNTTVQWLRELDEEALEKWLSYMVVNRTMSTKSNC